jgi:hypothetical protein
MEEHKDEKDDELFTLAEVSAKLGHRSVVTIRTWVAKRQIAAFKINRTWFVPSSEVQRIRDESLIPRIPPASEPASVDEGSEYENFFPTSDI